MMGVETSCEGAGEGGEGVEAGEGGEGEGRTAVLLARVAGHVVEAAGGAGAIADEAPARRAAHGGHLLVVLREDAGGAGERRGPAEGNVAAILGAQVAAEQGLAEVHALGIAGELNGPRGDVR